jgi:glycosyltransferase involved in cell wall biosynthesis
MSNSVQVFKNSALQALGDHPKLPIALSVAFYNNLRNFDLMIAAVQRQTQKNFELVICDDGSKPEVVQYIHQTLNQLKIPALHLWHEDKGFRKNRMLNWGVYHSHSDYMVFVDQDCLPHPEFVREHFENRQEKNVLCGRRMELTPWVSGLLTPEKIAHGFIEKNLWWILPAGSYMKDNNGLKGLYLRSPWLRQRLNRKHRPIVGCNFSLFKKDLVAINGFDWRYEAPGTGEDSDIDYRLGLIGVHMRPFVNTAVQYHVFHKLTQKENPNEAIFATVRAEGKAQTAHGLREQLMEAGIKPAAENNQKRD